jgi:VanZ family protein
VDTLHQTVALAVSGLAMSAKFRLSWLQLCGVLAFVLLIYAALMLPAKVKQMRTGHWFTEHFVGYFVAGIIICLGWRRPFLVAGILTITAVVLEGFQALSPNHSANLLSVLGGASGAWAAAFIVEVVRWASKRSRSASN